MLLQTEGLSVLEILKMQHELFKWPIHSLDKSKKQLPDIFIVYYLAAPKHTVFLVMTNKCQYLEENQSFINIEYLLKTIIITKSTILNI